MIGMEQSIGNGISLVVEYDPNPLAWEMYMYLATAWTELNFELQL